MLVRRYGWDTASSVTTILGLPLAMLGCYLAIIALWSAGSSAGDGPEHLAEAADRLAIAVRRQWEAEAELRRLNDPHPLPVSWEAADPGLVEDWAFIEAVAPGLSGGVPPRPAGRATGPADLDGTGDGLGDVYSRRVPTRRLVVLGGPGAGKTMLLVRLVLDLLERREPGQPVPVLVSLASWNPAEQHPRDWLEAQLIRDHPGLREPSRSTAGTVSLARALLDDRLLLPVLDGLDEVPEAVRGSAIARLNEALRPGDGLVLSCRTDEYRRAVRPAGGTPVMLRAAAGVALRALDTQAITTYLRRDAGSPEAAARWDPVLARLGTNVPAARVLSTPLMVGLARTIYSPRPGEQLASLPDPAELCDPARFPTRIEVERHLFDAFIHAAYRPHPDPARRCRWTAEQAERWLVHLAHELEHRRGGATDLAWWELRDAAPRRLPGLAVGLVAGLAGAVGFKTSWIGIGIGIIAGITAGLAVRRWSGASGSFARGAAGGIVGGLAGLVPQLLFGFGIRAEGFGDSITAAMTFAIAAASLGGFWPGLAGALTASLVGASVGTYDDGPAAWLVNGAGLGLAVGLTAELPTRREPARGLRWSPLGFACGTIIGPAVGFAIFLGKGPTTGLAVGLVVTVGAALSGGFTLEAARTDLTTAVGPDVVLRRDRDTFATTALVAGLAFGVSYGLGVGIGSGYLNGLGVGFADTVAAALAIGFLQARWGPFALARWLLAMRRLLPWQLMRFLADAHTERGVLRQVGAVYQFRHAELQRRLANRP